VAGPSLVKVIRFLRTGPDGERITALEELRRRWEIALASGRRSGRPARAALCRPLALAGAAPAIFSAVELTWFDSVGSALDHDQWLATTDRELAAGSSRLAGPPVTVVADEVVARGADYLERRWRQGGTRYKMMSLGRRRQGLTLAEFSRQWRSQAGRLGDAAIPSAYLGEAYIQNHPLQMDGADWPFDAVNEVYFDDLGALEGRRAYFEDNEQRARQSTAESFVSPTERWSMFVEEWPVGPSR
jgi:hypothetical protein